MRPVVPPVVGNWVAVGTVPGVVPVFVSTLPQFAAACLFPTPMHQPRSLPVDCAACPDSRTAAMVRIALRRVMRSPLRCHAEIDGGIACIRVRPVKEGIGKIGAERDIVFKSDVRTDPERSEGFLVNLIRSAGVVGHIPGVEEGKRPQATDKAGVRKQVSADFECRGYPGVALRFGKEIPAFVLPPAEVEFLNAGKTVGRRSRPSD